VAGGGVVDVERAQDVDLSRNMLGTDEFRGAEHPRQVHHRSHAATQGLVDVIDVPDVPGRQIERHRLMTPAVQLRAQMLADEPSRPGDQDFHEASIRVGAPSLASRRSRLDALSYPCSLLSAGSHGCVR